MQSKKPALPQGDTNGIKVEVVDDDGQVVDISGCTIVWKLAEEEASLAALLTKTLGDGLTMVNAEGGVFQVNITPEETATLPAKDYFHQARVTFPADHPVFPSAIKTVVRQYLSIVETV